MKIRDTLLTALLLLLGCVALAQASSESFTGISAIAWNGSTWLIGTVNGDLVSYAGGEFSYLGNLGGWIREIVWAQGYWLIGGAGVLQRYDGSFTNLSSEYDVLRIRCNKEYCLIAADPLSRPSYSRLLKYDGSSLADITSGIARGKRNWVMQMVWNGEYWLISVDFADERKVIGSGLFKYDGSSFTEVTNPELPPHGTLGWNGRYWLISSGVWINKTTGPEPRLLKYDGKNFSEIEFPLQVFERFDRQKGESLEPYIISHAFYTFPDMIAWNGEYWLMDTGFSLVRYDERNFSVVRYTTGVYSPYRVIKMVWNGRYWLILYNLAGEPGYALGKYDGQKLEWLRYEPLMHGYAWAPIGDVAWNGSAWLIGTFAHRIDEEWEYPKGMRYALLKYDGSEFKELTQEFKEAFLKSSERKARTGEVQGEAPSKKAVCGSAVAFLFVAPVLALRCRWWR